MTTLTTLVLGATARAREAAIAAAIRAERAPGFTPLSPQSPLPQSVADLPACPAYPVLSCVESPLPLPAAQGDRSAALPTLPLVSPPVPAPARTHAVLLEGLPDGQALLETLLFPGHLIRLAPGCLCCSGKLVMQVSVNRLLRHKPAQLFIALASTSHHAQLRALLQQAPYDAWLALGPDLNVELLPEPAGPAA